MKELLLHKIHITPEAIFDYQEDMKLGTLPGRDITEQLEIYLSIQQGEGRRLDRYQPIKYCDEITNNMLMLFITRSSRFGNMQIWDLTGICLRADWDWNEDDDGEIKDWYRIQIKDFSQPYYDWVNDLKGD